MKIKTLRKSLEKNKIFIDSFSGIVLTTIIVVLSYRTYINDENELLINEIEHSPRIIMEQWYYEGSNGKRGKEVLTIINEGYHLSNFKHELYTFVRINKRDRELKMLTSFAVPVGGYIGVGSLYKNSKGELATYFVNNTLFNQLQYEFAVEANTNGEFFYELEKVLLLKVEYCDYKNDVIIKYYCDDNSYRGSEIPEDVALDIIALDDEKKSFHLDETTPSDIIKIINSNDQTNLMTGIMNN